MIMAERADPVDNKTNGQAYLDNDFSITDIEHPLVSTTPTYSNILKNENETERELFTITVPLESNRREENPFSFKHFLKRDNPGISSNCTGTSTSNSNVQSPIVNHTGARPKVFSATANSTSPLTLPLDDLRTLPLKKCKNVSCDARCNDFCRHDFYNDSPKTAKTNSVENITYSNDCNPMKNLYRSYSDRDTSYKSLNTADNFMNHKHMTGRVNSSEFSSALPDFVQDHIVLEQWYSGVNSPLSTEHVEREINPDFSPMDRDTRQKRFHSGRSRSGLATDPSSDLPCDLMPGQEVPNRRSNSMSVPLDLPRNDNAPFDLPRNSPLNATFSNPLDLPSTFSLDLTGNVNHDLEQHQDYNCMQEVPQILPDFLSDGAIHSDRLADLVHTSPEGPGVRRQDPDIGNITDAVSRLSLENNRLRRELDCYRRQLSEQSSQISRLQSELSTTNQNEGQYTTKLATALETVEKNMARSNKRAIEAENTVTLLRKQISQMTSEMLLLKNENTALRYGPCCSNSQQANNMARLSSELRTAASTAETNLRQLLTGVDNLRSLADSLESCNRVFEPSDDNFGDNEDEGAGPAL